MLNLTHAKQHVNMCWFTQLEESSLVMASSSLAIHPLTVLPDGHSSEKSAAILTTGKLKAFEQACQVSCVLSRFCKTM